MARRYTLDSKIDTLNQLEAFDGDLMLTSDKLHISAKTIRNWRKHETDLRRAYRQKQQRYLGRLKADLLTDMLERSQAIVAQMDDEVLDNAPLNQLSSALGTLVNHALKLEEVIDDTDEQTEEEKEHIYRIEYVYDGEIHETPPWAEEDSEPSESVSDSGVWQAVGEDRTGEDNSARSGHETFTPRMVARSDVSDVEPSLAGLEDDSQERDWYHD